MILSSFFLLFLGDPQPAHKDVKCCDFDNCNGASKNGQIGAIIGLSMFSIWQLLGQNRESQKTPSVPKYRYYILFSVKYFYLIVKIYIYVNYQNQYRMYFFNAIVHTMILSLFYANMSSRSAPFQSDPSSKDAKLRKCEGRWTSW